MAIRFRGWPRSKSTAARLAACEQLIGHEFSNLDLLKQALDNRESSSRRLAVIGDRAVETHLAHRWWKRKNLSGTQWTELRSSVLCNENLSNVGFRTGLNECTIPDACDTNMKSRMATTIEALLAAVWLDTNRDATAFDGVIDRLGLTHTLLNAGTMGAWGNTPITSMRMLPRCFFSGHHISLTKALSEMEQPMIPPRISTSGNMRLAAGEASLKQEAEPKKSEAQKPVSTNIRTEVEHLYMRIEEDATRQLSRQVPQSKQASREVSSDDAEQPDSNSSIQRAKENTVQAHVTREEGARDLDSSDLDAEKGAENANQTVHDEGPLYRGKIPKSEGSVEWDLPSDAKADPSESKRFRVQEQEPIAHQETRAGGETNSKTGSKRDATLQEIQELEKRVQRLVRKQRIKPNDNRLEVLREVVAELIALKEIRS